MTDQRLVMYATLGFFCMALYIWEAAFSTLATQNRFCPFAILVLTNPGRISVIKIGDDAFAAFIRNPSR